MALYTVHGGHAAHGNRNCGAVGWCSESLVDRAVCKSVIKHLQDAGNTAVDCSVDSGLTQSSIVTAIKKKINSYPGARANISIHLNANKKTKADGKNKGCEVLIYATNTEAEAIAIKVCLQLKALGFTNRGVKVRTDLGVLKGIKNGGANILVECFFCDDEDDYKLFNKVGVDAIGKAIADGVRGKLPVSTTVALSNFIMAGVDYSPVFNPTYYALKNTDVAKAVGNNDETELFKHFYHFGMDERRIASADFNVNIYMERYPDLKNAFGKNYKAYYQHYCTIGKDEGRKGI